MRELEQVRAAVEAARAARRAKPGARAKLPEDTDPRPEWGEDEERERADWSR